jgi:hypothetical protein
VVALLDAELLAELSDLVAAAMDDDHFVALLARSRDRLAKLRTRARLFQLGAADLDENPHCSPSVSGSPSITFMFWSA